MTLSKSQTLRGCWIIKKAAKSICLAINYFQIIISKLYRHKTKSYLSLEILQKHLFNYISISMIVYEEISDHR